MADPRSTWAKLLWFSIAPDQIILSSSESLRLYDVGDHIAPLVKNIMAYD